MDLSIILILVGLLFNTAASLVMLYPYLRAHENVDDDLIVDMDHKGNYKQKRHLKGRKLGKVGFILFTIGFGLQFFGVFLQV